MEVFTIEYKPLGVKQMMNFNFRLERVLNFKDTVEELKKAEYGNAQRKLNQEEDKLNSYNQHKNVIKYEKTYQFLKLMQVIQLCIVII